MLPPRKDRGQKELFYYFDPESLIPQDYVLRKIDRLIDFRPIRKKLAKFYTPGFGRPAVDPEVMFRILLLGYLFGLSENQLFRELKMHLGYRWFCKLSPDEAVPDRTTLNKLRNHRWAESGIVVQFLRQVIEQCIDQGLVKARYLSVDGSQVEANASISRFEPIEVEETVDEFLARFELAEPTGASESPRTDQGNSEKSSQEPEGQSMRQETQSRSREKLKETTPRKGRKDFRGERLSNTTHRCTTDPDARLYRKGKGKEAKLSYLMHDLVDAESGVILGRCVTEARGSAEREAALEMLDGLKQAHPELVQEAALLGDKNYCVADFLVGVEDRGLEPLVSVRSDLKPKAIPQYKRAPRDSAQEEKRQRKQRQIEATNGLLGRAQTRKYRSAQKLRLTNERVFAEAKVLGMRRTRYRGLPKVECQAVMTAAVQNLRRLLSWESRHRQAPSLKLKMSVGRNQDTSQTSSSSHLFCAYYHRHHFGAFLGTSGTRKANFWPTLAANRPKRSVRATFSQVS